MGFLTEVEKRILLDRYSEIEWFDEVDDFQCVHCHRVAISHCVFTCQHLICKNCREITSEVNQQLKCPECPWGIIEPDELGFDVEVNINQLLTYCPNQKYGCKYLNTLKTIPSHLMTCVDTREKALLTVTPKGNTMEDIDNHLKNLNDTVGELRVRMKMVNNKVEEKFNQMERKIDDIDHKIDALTSEDNKVEGIKPDMQLASTNSKEVIP